MKNPKTTVAGMCTALATVLSAVAAWQTSGHPPDLQTVLTTVMGLLAALGLYHASDGGK